MPETNKKKTNINPKTNKEELEVCNIAQGTTIKGNLKVESNIRIEGIIEGTVTCSGRLVLSKTGKIKGDILCKNIISEGIVYGDIVAKDKIHLLSSAVITGNIKYNCLQIDLGATLNGQAICASSPSVLPQED